MSRLPSFRLMTTEHTHPVWLPSTPVDWETVWKQGSAPASWFDPRVNAPHHLHLGTTSFMNERSIPVTTWKIRDCWVRQWLRDTLESDTWNSNLSLAKSQASNIHFLRWKEHHVKCLHAGSEAAWAWSPILPLTDWATPGSCWSLGASVFTSMKRGQLYHCIRLQLSETILVKHSEPSLAHSKYPVIFCNYLESYFQCIKWE